LINEVRLDGLQHVLPAAGLGWVVTEPATETVCLLDHDLQLVRRVSLPFAVPRLNVSATSRFIAIADNHELVVLDSAGDICWRRPWHRFGADPANTDVPFHVDTDSILFLSVRELATESVLAKRHLDDLPDLPTRGIGVGDADADRAGDDQAGC